jgi:hypothetical protein
MGAMTVTLVAPVMRDVSYIAANMRDADARDIRHPLG